MPIPPGAQDRWVRKEHVNLPALWRHLGRPVLHDEGGTIWALGAGSSERADRLRALEAPDFELPDLHGNLHRLSQHRGRRVLLVTWASW